MFHDYVCSWSGLGPAGLTDSSTSMAPSAFCTDFERTKPFNNKRYWVRRFRTKP